MSEQCRPMPNLPGYEASDLGLVRYGRRQTVRTGSPGPCGFRTVSLTRNGVRRFVRVGTLVAEAWIGPRPLLEVRRLDGDPLNDRVSTSPTAARLTSRADHAARAERERSAGAPDICPSGHRYADSWLGDWGKRFCPGCRRDRNASY